MWTFSPERQQEWTTISLTNVAMTILSLSHSTWKLERHLRNCGAGMFDISPGSIDWCLQIHTIQSRTRFLRTRHNHIFVTQKIEPFPKILMGDSASPDFLPSTGCPTHTVMWDPHIAIPNNDAPMSDIFSTENAIWILKIASESS